MIKHKSAKYYLINVFLFSKILINIILYFISIKSLINTKKELQTLKSTYFNKSNESFYNTLGKSRNKLH